MIVFDTECFPNYWMIAFMSTQTGKTRFYERYPGHDLDRDAVREVLNKFTLVGFNSNSYDMPMIMLALTGADNERLKQCSDSIVRTQLRPWQVADKYSFSLDGLQDINHIDLIEVAPGRASLKLYGARLGTRSLRDNPLDVDKPVAPRDRQSVIDYCLNDLRITADLAAVLEPQLALRTELGASDGLDLRSKSDAQIAESVIGNKLSAVLKTYPSAPKIAVGAVRRYTPPPFIEFRTPVMQDVLETIEDAEFVTADSGKVLEPETLKGLTVRIGNGAYRLGIGGLHSSEKSAAHVCDGTFILCDRDVASYYPSIILNCNLFPKHLTAKFLDVYRELVLARLDAKHAGRKTEADSLKITVNGTFGKLGSKYSLLYSPDLLIQVTLTGQLALLMLIESLESEGIPVVSANTDGIVIKCPVDKVDMMKFVVWEWETVTRFETEETRYAAIYSRDVNNYIAVKEGGGAKVKGAFAPVGLHKNPRADIVADAVIAFLAKGIPLVDTIRGCSDIKKFVVARTVTGGAVRGETYLGRVVRWYYSTQMTGALHYKLNGYTVPTSEGARPVQDLPHGIPNDLDYQWYLNEALRVLDDVGAMQHEFA